MLQIITSNAISDKKMLILNEFNTHYNAWIDSHSNQLTFIEMQSKLLCLLQYILLSIQKNTGLMQLCKIKPDIKLRYIADGTTRIVQILQDENNNTTRQIINEVTTNEDSENHNNNNQIQITEEEENDYETLELGEMLINCISYYSSVFEQSDFENLGGPMTRIIENTENIEKIQKELYEYQDLEAMFSE